MSELSLSKTITYIAPLVLLFTGLSYLCTYYYNIGFLSYFGVSTLLINIDLPSIIPVISAVSLIGLLVLIGAKNILDRTSNNLSFAKKNEQKMKISTLIGVGMFLLVPFCSAMIFRMSNVKDIVIGFSLIILFIYLADIFLRKSLYLLYARRVYMRNFFNPIIKGSMLNTPSTRLALVVIGMILYIILFSQYLGESSAKRLTAISSFTIHDKQYLLISIYNQKMIGIEYQQKTNEIYKGKIKLIPEDNIELQRIKINNAKLVN